MFNILKQNIFPLLVGSWKTFRSHITNYLAISIIAILLAVFLSRWDDPWLEMFRYPDSVWAHELAGALSHWGEPHLSVLPVCIFLIALGVWRKMPIFKYAGIACILAVLVSGLLVNILRPALGRPRPSSGLPDKLYFFEMNYNYHGTPSGHATACASASACLAVVLPVTAIVTVPYTLSVCWSRMQLKRHHPTDILLGLALGEMVGVAFGGAAKELSLGENLKDESDASLFMASLESESKTDSLKS